MLRETPPTRPVMLVVEDDAQVRKIVRTTFDADYEVYEAGNGAEGLELARRYRPAVIISDQRMPEMNGTDFLAQVKEELPNAIRVLVTGYSDYGPVVQALNSSEVHHYFEKPFHVVDLRGVVDALTKASEMERQRDELLGQLQSSVAELEGVNRQLREREEDLSTAVSERTRALQDANSELREANTKLREMAVRDGLTGLFNHRCLVEHIELEVARSVRYGREFSLLFLDLDHFKSINDRFGHSVGDSVLIRVASLLMPSLDGLRHSDFAARYGGEEFCVILPETPLEGGKIKAERVRAAVGALTWADLDLGEEITLTTSIGVAAFPENGRTANDVLEAADAALYRAKHAGRNCVRATDE